MKTYLHKILFISLSCSLISGAQEKAKKKEILPAKLAIIAIGPKPPRRYGGDGGKGSKSAGAMLPPHPGEIPPRRLHFDVTKKKKNSSTKTDDKEPKQSSINVTFNNPSHFIEVPPNKTLSLQRREQSEYSKYISIGPLQPGSMTVILLRPTGTGFKRWVSEPTQHKINLFADSLKNKKLAILNLSRRPIKSIFHDDKKMITSGGFQAYESIEGLELHRMAAAYGQEDKIIYNTALRLNKSNRLLFYVLYDANPNTNDGRTVGLFRTSVEPEVKPEPTSEKEQQIPEELPTELLKGTVSEL
ncbi:MAG: hypothetical protein ACSHX6_03275 [Akkermansiaceae bacterium]